ncbi:HET-domain-containing protein [Lindgomyces ingoldianus]|uniref:HET-domain-containing protein n=1 Tax=Lindgomyces ingoldianus TaxID=673940 RepID=A0ACB6QBE2_9PLEO|nr:HET-domain-containing protein [Lindgomyces ingoldianus]KAF2464175.1 HET-domain-containing protein [Lindgomyces ingoldianus]
MDFCYSCRQLDISLSSFISHPGTDDNPHLKAPIYSLGTLEQISARIKGCHLCRLTFAAFRNGPLRNINSLSDLSQIAIFGTWINALGPSREQRLKSSALSILVWPESPRIPQAAYKLVIRAVSRLLPDQPHFGRLSSVKSDFLDFELIRRWLQHCEKNHATCHGNNNDLLVKPTETFIVIDVKQECIVHAPDNCRYIALSYVWGDTIQLTLSGEKFKEFSQKHSLRNVQLPQTVSDAIELVEKLGERYLWVDALCIVQDSDVIRRQCIEDMDRIYTQSLLTIVAGTAENSNSPLPGVTEKRTWRQWGSQISPNLALSLHFDFKDFLDCSTYNQRAWTFQEYQLANRLLVFASNGQVYHSCKEAVYSEDVVPGKTLESDAAMQDGAELIKLRPDNCSLWSTYRRGVQTFSSRSMTHERDILNAFRGILRMICPGRTLEGLPVSIFDMALLWQPRERLTRRVGFSTWSWAGWLGKIHWFDDGSLEGSIESSETQKVEAWLKEKCWIVWYSSFGTNAKSAIYLREGPPWLRGFSPSATDHGRRFGFRPRNFAPTPDMLPRRLDKLEPQRKHIRYLQFWTISAYFKIEPDTSAVLKFSSFDPENTGNGLRLFLLRDASGQTCGWVLLDEGWTERAAREDVSLQEFILLSEGQNPTTERSPYVVHPSNGGEPVNDFQEFNAVMISWTGGIAERAGLGRIVKGALWRTCKRGMKWKEILLG